MKAAIVKRYGPPEVVQIVDLPRPEPKDNEVLIRTHVTTVNSGDARVRAANVPKGMHFLFRLAMGWNGPRKNISGFELAGEVAAVGREVTKFAVGDRVLGSNEMGFGCHAEYVCLPEDGALVVIPTEMSYADAVALLFGGLTSLTFFRHGQLKAGESLLINGSSGAVGVMAIQLAKHMGAEVTAVCSTANVDLVRSLGADHVIDYTNQDFTKQSIRYDVIMDNHGNAPYGLVKGLLKPGGRFLAVIADLWGMISGKFNSQVVSPNQTDGVFDIKNFNLLLELTQKGVIKPVIGASFPFERIVEAHRLVDGGHKKGSLVLTFDHPVLESR